MFFNGPSIDFGFCIDWIYCYYLLYVLFFFQRVDNRLLDILCRFFEKKKISLIKYDRKSLVQKKKKLTFCNPFANVFEDFESSNQR